MIEATIDHEYGFMQSKARMEGRKGGREEGRGGREGRRGGRESRWVGE